MHSCPVSIVRYWRLQFYPACWRWNKHSSYLRWSASTKHLTPVEIGNPTPRQQDPSETGWRPVRRQILWGTIKFSSKSYQAFTPMLQKSAKHHNSTLFESLHCSSDVECACRILLVGTVFVCACMLVILISATVAVVWGSKAEILAHVWRPASSAFKKHRKGKDKARSWSTAEQVGDNTQLSSGVCSNLSI